MKQTVKTWAAALAAVLAVAVLIGAACAANAAGTDRSYAEDPVVEEPFRMQSFPAMQKAGKLSFAGGLAGVTPEDAPNGKGIVVTAKKSKFADGRVEIADRFDFGVDRAGRILIDALGDKNLKVDAEIYLDDAETPACVIRLRNQNGKLPWVTDGATSTTIYRNETQITGEHSVSVRFVDQSAKDPDKKISVCLRGIEFAKMTIPVVDISIDETQGSISEMNADEDHNAECYGDLAITVPDGYESEYGGAQQDVVLPMEYIRGRGNSTWSADKKPYKVKLNDKTDLFGMGANKHWLLIANRFDNTSVRNKMTYWLGDQLGMEFTPQSVPVEVTMNGRYYGLYFLCEQIRVGESRVEIPDLEDQKKVTTKPEITGGYLISMEPYEDDAELPAAFSTERANFFLESPGFEDYMNETQMNYIKGFMQDTENAIFGENYCGANGRSYDTYLDVEAAQKYWWFQAVSLNGDAYGSGSTYLYKRRDSSADAEDGLLYWGPLWDFDYVAWGDLQYEGNDIEGFGCEMPWFQKLFRNREFAEGVVARWPLLREKLEYVIQENGLLDQYYEMLYDARQYDYEKWGQYDEYWGGDYGYADIPDGMLENIKDIEDIIPDDGGDEPPAPRTYKEEMDQLKSWIRERIDWVDAHVNELIPKPCTVKFVANKKVVATKTLISGDMLGKLPKGPAKKGYTFFGWTWKDEIVDEEFEVRKNMTLQAMYLSNRKVAEAKRIYFAETDMTLYTDGELTLDYKLKPWNSVANVKWTTSNRKVAYPAGNGVVLAAGKGTCKITATLKNGFKQSVTVRVIDGDDEEYEAASLRLLQKKATVGVGGFTQIKVKLSPQPCYGTDRIWRSLNKKIATVDSYGIITGKKPGKTSVVMFDTELRVMKVIPVTVKAAKPAAAKLKSAKGGKKRVTVKWRRVAKKANLRRITGYKIQIARNRKFTKGRKTVTVKGWKKTRRVVKGLKRGKVFVRIRTYQKLAGKTYVSKWSRPRKAKIS